MQAFADLWQELLRDAVSSGASDVHLGPISQEPHSFHLLLRVGGQLKKRASYSAELGSILIDQLKRLAHLNVGERHQPQDGRLSLAGCDFRVSTLPCAGGEKAVLRVLRSDQRPQLQSLGLPSPAVAAIRAAIQRPRGLIVIAGATGSGKTTTIHALLGDIDTEQRNTVTLEDPIEYRSPELCQVEISHRLTFAAALRALLRQDPDVIFVGECRDPETAQLALEAANTGHLVLTTIHASSLSQVSGRFEALGCCSSDLEEALSFAAFQELVPGPSGLALNFAWRTNP